MNGFSRYHSVNQQLVFPRWTENKLTSAPRLSDENQKFAFQNEITWFFFNFCLEFLDLLQNALINTFRVTYNQPSDTPRQVVISFDFTTSVGPYTFSFGKNLN